MEALTNSQKQHNVEVFNNVSLETLTEPASNEQRPTGPLYSYSKSSVWKLPSLDSILEYKEAMDKEKMGSTTNVISISGQTDEDTTSAAPCRRFRCTASEVLFCFSMALTQLLAEYMISGFAVILPTLLERFSANSPSDLWPATVLSLVLCSTILPFARLSDMYGGYPVFMLSVLWFCAWCIIGGFCNSLILLNISRAMQGLAIAAYTPSSFALFGCIYPTGPRRNLALGVYGACAPLGFFAGIYVSSALSVDRWQWYFWVAAIAAFIALVAAFLSVPSDRSDRLSLNLTMDWSGAITTISGLILIVYSLAASASEEKAWQTPGVLAPFLLGLISLASAVYIELRVAKCPLVPLAFFKQKSVAPLLLACIFFYGSFGTWLFTTTNHLRLAYNVTGLRLALWFLPMAIGGFIFAVLGSGLIHKLSPTIVLLVSGMAWITAPLLLALGDSTSYWPFIFPAMICATLGIDLTFTVTSVVLSSSSPIEWQGLAGAVNSVAVNLGIAFSLAIAEIIQIKSEGGVGGDEPTVQEQLLGYRNSFLFAAASAVIGFGVTVVAVRISKDVVMERRGSTASVA